MQPIGKKVALVTGASSGIGRASALALADAGFVVYATARRPEALAELEGAGLRTLRLDVTDEDSMISAVAAVEAEHGGIDVLVNNAGYVQMGPVEEVSLEQWRKQFETNVFGLVRLTQLALPAMRARGEGRVVNVGSAGGEYTLPLSGTYHASKYAVEAISDALRLEVGPFGVWVVLVQPGVVDTPMGRASAGMLRGKPGSPYERQMDAFGETARQQMERGTWIVKPERVAEVVVRAARSRSPRARYKVGAMAVLLPALRRWLPAPLWEAAIGSTLPKPEPGAVVRDEVFVGAPPERVWGLLTDVDSWPEWRSDVSRAELGGALGVGSVFRWRSGGLNIVSTVQEAEPGRRLGWTGEALGTRAVHTWTFEPREGGVLVKTEEAVDGWMVRILTGPVQKSIKGALRTGLVDLKRRAERGA